MDKQIQAELVNALQIQEEHEERSTLMWREVNRLRSLWRSSLQVGDVVKSSYDKATVSAVSTEKISVVCDGKTAEYEEKNNSSLSPWTDADDLKVAEKQRNNEIFTAIKKLKPEDPTLKQICELLKTTLRKTLPNVEDLKAAEGSAQQQ